LDRDLRHAWQPIQAHQVADDEELGVPGTREVRLDLHPSRPIHLDAGLLAEQTAERRRLHAGGPDLGGRLDATQLGVLEVRLARAGGHDQAVVRDGGASVEGVHHQQAGDDIDVHHLAQEHPGVGLVPEDVTDRRRDLALAQNPDHHLVEQGLEEVMVSPVDHRDLDLPAPQRPGGKQAPEAAAHDRHPIPATLRSVRSSHGHASQRTSLRSFTVIA
jgi:hypothetical protein